MTKHPFIPLDPGEIEHVLYLLKQDLDPEAIRLDPAGARYHHGVADHLRTAIAAVVTEQPLGTWRQPRDRSDWANLAADSRVSDLVRACARVHCTLWWLESNAESQAKHPPGAGDAPVAEWRADWDRLRSSMIEVAHWLTSIQLIDEEKRAKHAAAHADALRGAAEQAKVFREGRKRGTLAAHNEYLLSVLTDNPDLTHKEIARLVEDKATVDATCPFERDGDAVVIRATGKSIDIAKALRNLKTRQLN